MNGIVYAQRLLSIVAVLGFLWIAAPQGVQAQADGKQLFQTKCAACHSTGNQRLTGPGLEGVSSRRDKAWLIKWIRNSSEMVASGDSLAVAIFNEFNKIPMLPFPDLQDADIEAILAYIDNPTPTPPANGGGTAAADEKPSTEAQMKEWTETSEGLGATTIIPLIMLTVLLIILWLAGQKIPGMD